MRIIFMGSPEFAVTPLRYLLLNRYSVAAVYTQPDRPAGRGRESAAPPVKRLALDWDLEVRQPESLRRPEAVAEVAGLGPDIIVVAAYGQILPPAVLAVPRYGCVNIHPSLLPRFRGASPVAAAILAGDEFTGVSIMLMDAGMDTGPVLGQAQIPISEGDTTGSLTAKLARVGAEMLVELLPRHLLGSISPRPQDEARASYCRPIGKEAGEIDWHMPAVELTRRVRAYNPWPGAYTRWQGKRLKILSAVPLPDGEGQPGQVTSLASGTGFGVVTGEGMLAVCQVQLEGKRPVTGAEFRRGQRGFIGAQLC